MKMLCIWRDLKCCSGKITYFSECDATVYCSSISLDTRALLVSEWVSEWVFQTCFGAHSTMHRKLWW
jgi:hypothetical protein